MVIKNDDPCFPFGTGNARDEYDEQRNPENVKKALALAVQNMPRAKKANEDWAKILKLPLIEVSDKVPDTILPAKI